MNMLAAAGLMLLAAEVAALLDEAPTQLSCPQYCQLSGLCCSLE